MGSGSNVVIFDPQDVAAVDLQYLRVDQISFQFRELGDYEDPYEEGPYDYLTPDPLGFSFEPFALLAKR